MRSSFALGLMAPLFALGMAGSVVACGSHSSSSTASTAGSPASGGAPAGGAAGAGNTSGSGGASAQGGAPVSVGGSSTAPNGGAPSAGATSGGASGATSGGTTASGEAGGSSGGSGGLGGFPNAGGGGTSGATEAVHYGGRWDRQASRATTVNSGSFVSAHFSGTGLSARFDVSVNDKSDLPTVAWRVDQASTWQVAEVQSSLSLATGLTGGEHTITLIARGLDENKSRWTPPLVSGLVFLGFDVTGGALQLAAVPSLPKLEILGDSITEGVVVQGSSYQGKSGQCWKNDAVYSYPTQTGMMLNADYRQVGFGYQGLLKGGDGGVPAANDSFAWIYKNVQRDAWQADWVVINQGTNDSTQPAANFKTAYTAFVATIRKAYPNARIVALRPFGGAQEAQIKGVVAASNAAGDARTFYVDTTGWLTPGSDFTDNLHPNVQGSGKAAAKLVAELKKLGFP